MYEPRGKGTRLRWTRERGLICHGEPRGKVRTDRLDEAVGRHEDAECLRIAPRDSAGSAFWDNEYMAKLLPFIPWLSALAPSPWSMCGESGTSRRSRPSPSMRQRLSQFRRSGQPGSSRRSVPPRGLRSRSAGRRPVTSSRSVSCSGGRREPRRVPLKVEARSVEGYVAGARQGVVRRGPRPASNYQITR